MEGVVMLEGKHVGEKKSTARNSRRDMRSWKETQTTQWLETNETKSVRGRRTWERCGTYRRR